MAKLSADEKYCSSCGAIIKKAAELCIKCGVRGKGSSEHSPKSKVTAGVLALLFGGIGAHKFYLGYSSTGFIHLCLCWTFIPAIISLAEGIIYLTKTDEEFYEIYVKNKKEFF